MELIEYIDALTNKGPRSQHQVHPHCHHPKGIQQYRQCHCVRARPAVGSEEQLLVAVQVANLLKKIKLNCHMFSVSHFLKILIKSLKNS